MTDLIYIPEPDGCDIQQMGFIDRVTLTCHLVAPTIPILIDDSEWLGNIDFNNNVGLCEDGLCFEFVTGCFFCESCAYRDELHVNLYSGNEDWLPFVTIEGLLLAMDCGE